MEIVLVRSLEALLLLPGIFIILMAIGLLLLFRAINATTQAIYLNEQTLVTAAEKISVRSRVLQRIAIACLTLALLGLYAFSIPVTARALMAQVETYPALMAAHISTNSAQAIVVLGAGRYAAPEYNGTTLSSLALERLRYGAYLHRQTGLPLVLSGGDPFNEGISEAVLMQRALLNDLQIDKAEIEEKSSTTAENAFFTRNLLAKQGIKRIYLVTHAAHMPRAVQIFEQAGLRVIPAPLHFLSLPSAETRGVLGWLPSAKYLERSNAALHELLGRVWYGLRY